MKRLVQLLLVASVATSAQAASLRWEGDAPAGGDAMALALQVAHHASESEALEQIRRELSDRAYFWPTIQAQRDTFVVAAGPAGAPGEIRISCPEVIEFDCAERFREALAGRTDRAAIEAGLLALVNALVADGHPFTQVRLLGLDVSQPPQVDFTFAVHPGPEVFTGALRTGARRTRTDVFEREAGWERGELLDLAVIKRSESGVEALPFVADVDTARLIAITGDTADLYLPVNEAAGLRAGGVVGYVPRQGTVPGYWGGELDLELSSPFGGGRSVLLNAARQDPDSRRTAISYWEPWPWRAPIWVGFMLRQDDFSTDFIETEATARVRLAAHTPRWEAQVTWSRIAIEEAPSPSTFAARRYGVGLAVAGSGPDAGYRFGLRWNHQRLFPRPELAVPQASVDISQAEFEAYRWLGPQRGFFLRSLATGAGTLVGSGFVPPNLLYRVGGVHSLRGYREEEFLVRDFLRLVLEGHVGNRCQSLFVFVEGAWLNFATARNLTLGSAGIGVRVADRFLLQFGVPSVGGFEAAKIHLGFTTGR